jgi:hypothetical protein
MTDVELECCVPYGLLENAIETQQSLLEEYGRGLDTFDLVACAPTGQGQMWSPRYRRVSESIRCSKTARQCVAYRSSQPGYFDETPLLR